QESPASETLRMAVPELVPEAPPQTPAWQQQVITDTAHSDSRDVEPDRPQFPSPSTEEPQQPAEPPPASHIDPASGVVTDAQQPGGRMQISPPRRASAMPDVMLHSQELGSRLSQIAAQLAELATEVTELERQCSERDDAVRAILSTVSGLSS